MSHRTSSNANPNMHFDMVNMRLKKGKTTTSVPSSKSTSASKHLRETASSKSKLTMQNANLPPTGTFSRNGVRNNNLRIQQPPPGNGRNPLYEMTVRTQKNAPNPGQRPATANEPWSRMLQTQSQSTDANSFNHFDPLRTVHFLSKELQFKLVQKMPADYAILQMLDEIQTALTRVPPDLLAALKIQALSEKGSTDTPRTVDSDYPKVEMTHKGVQTTKSVSLIASEKLQKHIEESSVKIEAACAQMGAVCTKLKLEKSELESSLNAEKQMVEKLREQLATHQQNATIREDELRRRLTDLESARQEQEVEIRKLNAQMDNKQTVASEDLKLLIYELRNKKAEAEKDMMRARHELTLISMDNEKMKALISTRERQLEEMRREMGQLQEVVNDQLVEFQNVRSMTEHSSVSTLTDANMWPERDNFGRVNLMGDASTAPEDKEPKNLMVIKKSSTFCKANVSGDDSFVSTQLKNATDAEEASDYAYKDVGETGGDARYLKTLPASLKKSEDFLDSNTTMTTVAPAEVLSAIDYESCAHDPSHIKDLIAAVKNEALCISAGLQEGTLDL